MAKAPGGQSEAIHGWKPWEKSTGPRTLEGKAASSKNATKHGMRGQEWREFERQLMELMKVLRRQP